MVNERYYLVDSPAGCSPEPTAGIAVRSVSSDPARSRTGSPIRPLDNSEYTSQLETFADLERGRLNTALFLDGAAVAKFDLVSVALHKIGHVLGLTTLFEIEHGDVPVAITDPLPIAGFLIPFRRGHLY